MPTLEVRPLSISCLCRNKLTRARPRPSSNAPVCMVAGEYPHIVHAVSRLPRVNTPNVVDLPLSTFPTTAQRTSGVVETSGGGNRKSKAARGCSGLLSKSIEVCTV